MVLDTSAILAILQDEPERRKFNEAIEAAETRSLSTASFVECPMILESRYGSDGVRDLDLFIAKAQVSLVSVDGEQADLARRRFSSRETTSVKLTSSVILPAANDRRRAKAHKRARCLVKERAAKRLSGHNRPPARGRVKHHANVHCAE